MQALVRFAHIAGGDTFTTRDLHPAAAAALDATTDQYRLASLRYDLSKLRAKGLVDKVPHSRRYRLFPKGYTICVIFLKLFERVYAPLTAGLLARPRRYAARRGQAPSTRPPLPTRGHGPRRPPARSWAQDRRMTRIASTKFSLTTA